MNDKKQGLSLVKFFVIVFVFYFMFILIIGNIDTYKNRNDGYNYSYSDSVFSIITTPENKVLEDTIKDYADKEDFDVEIVYADNLEIVDILNSGEKYDAVWASNSIWLDMLDSKTVKTSNLKSTSITPVVFGVKKSLAESLNLVNRNVTMNDLLKLVKEGKLKFSMANPITTNSGASAYLNILSTLAGNPEVLTMDYLEDEKLKKDLTDFFSGLERTSGDEDFLEESFINGDYDAAISYESSIININKKLESSGKEPLYLIYPFDGVSISDSPLVFINNGNNDKKEIFLDFQSFILSDDGQKVLDSLGRRTWYGGINDSVNQSTFNKEWGIDTTKYISPVKYPSKDVIREALFLYQTELRKPVHVVFCLDYSGSMDGDGIDSLESAMDFIFGSSAITNMIQFSYKDKIDVILFNSSPTLIGSFTGNQNELILNKIKSNKAYGGTALYPAAKDALIYLQNETNDYNLSVILMTDGEGNYGTFEEVRNTYDRIGREIPIYSITFASASEEQLNRLARLSNGKVFDGRSDLVKAFKTVRGYN